MRFVQHVEDAVGRHGAVTAAACVNGMQDVVAGRVRAIVFLAVVRVVGWREVFGFRRCGDMRPMCLMAQFADVAQRADD